MILFGFDCRRSSRSTSILFSRADRSEWRDWCVEGARARKTNLRNASADAEWAHANIISRIVRGHNHVSEAEKETPLVGRHGESSGFKCCTPTETKNCRRRRTNRLFKYGLGAHFPSPSPVGSENKEISKWETAPKWFSMHSHMRFIVFSLNRFQAAPKIFRDMCVECERRKRMFNLAERAARRALCVRACGRVCDAPQRQR